MRKRLLMILAVLVLLVLASGGVALSVYRGKLEPAEPGGEARTFVVAPGQGLGQIARGLERAGLVRDWRAVEIAGRWKGLADQLRAGEYELSPGEPALTLLEHIVAGRIKTYPVVIPEGLRASEIADRLAEAGLAQRDEFLAYALSPQAAANHGVEGTGLEGYLYPDTYRIPRGMSSEQIAGVLISEFHRVWGTIEERARARGLSMREAVTLASIVEKETGAPEERPRIAGVFHNRLGRGMRLESDPTTIYGIADFDGNLRRVHLKDASNPYNTYRIPSLPPGPIASPGRAALEAVVEPERNDFLYFVARGDGTHHFSKTYREHTNAVLRYQIRRRSG